MATRTYPAVMTRDSETQIARTADQYWNLYWFGWRPTDAPVPVDEDDGFSDAAVAALIRNMSSETYAALADMVVTKLQLRLSQTPPVAPPAGTVWIDTSP